MVKDDVTSLSVVGLAVVEILGFFVKATGAVDCATRDEEGSAYSLSVGDVTSN